jgi:hypothetical protein
MVHVYVMIHLLALTALNYDALMIASTEVTVKKENVFVLMDSLDLIVLENV